MQVRVYTDGASSPHHATDGPGGYAALMFINGDFHAGRYGGWKSATNNQMELMGLITALRLLPTVERYRCKSCGIVDMPHPLTEECTLLGSILRPVYPEALVISDSQYCVKGATSWVYGWQANGWKTADKKPVKNRGLWEQVSILTKQKVATFQWVKGHNGDPGNELADEWAGHGKVKMYGAGPNDEWDIPMNSG